MERRRASHPLHTNTQWRAVSNHEGPAVASILRDAPLARYSLGMRMPYDSNPGNAAPGDSESPPYCLHGVAMVSVESGE
jgi:hypothetical protein